MAGKGKKKVGGMKMRRKGKTVGAHKRKTPRVAQRRAKPHAPRPQRVKAVRFSGPAAQRRRVPVAVATNPHRTTTPNTGGAWMKFAFFMGRYNTDNSRARIVLNPGLWRYHADGGKKNQQFSIPIMWQQEFARNQKYALRNLRFVFSPVHGTSIGTNIMLRYHADSSESDSPYVNQVSDGDGGDGHKIANFPTLDTMLATSGQFTHGPFTGSRGQTSIRVPMRAGGNKYLRFFNEHHATLTLGHLDSPDIYDNPLYLPTSEEMEKDYGVVEFVAEGPKSGDNKDAWEFLVQMEVDVKLSEWSSTNALYPPSVTALDKDFRDSLLLTRQDQNPLSGFNLVQLSPTYSGPPDEITWNYKAATSVVPSAMWQVSHHPYVHNNVEKNHYRLRPKQAGMYVATLYGATKMAPLEDLSHNMWYPDFRLSMTKFWGTDPIKTQLIPVLPERGAITVDHHRAHHNNEIFVNFTIPWVLDITDEDIANDADYRLESTLFDVDLRTGILSLKVKSIELKNWKFGDGDASHQHVQTRQEVEIADGVYETQTRKLRVAPKDSERDRKVQEEEAEYPFTPP